MKPSTLPRHPKKPISSPRTKSHYSGVDTPTVLQLTTSKQPTESSTNSPHYSGVAPIVPKRTTPITNNQGYLIPISNGPPLLNKHINNQGYLIPHQPHQPHQSHQSLQTQPMTYNTLPPESKSKRNNILSKHLREQAEALRPHNIVNNSEALYHHPEEPTYTIV